MTTNLFVIANVKQLRTGGSFRILLSFFRTSWRVSVPNSAIFNSFHNRVEFGTILEGLRNSGRGFEPLKPHPPRYASASYPSLCSSFNVTDHVSDSHKTTRKITVLNFLIFIFFDDKGEDRRS